MRFIRSTVSLLCLLNVALISCANGAGESQRKMLAETKIDRTHAEVIALGRARGGTIKSSSVQRLRGRLVWSCEIATVEPNGISTVLIDAKTGKVLSVCRAR